MSTTLGYALGYNDGRSAAKRSRQTREIIDRVFHGSRPVTVEQSYLDGIIDTARHNFHVGREAQNSADAWEAKARQMHGEALQWKGLAEKRAAELAARDATLAARNAEIAQLKVRVNNRDAAIEMYEGFTVNTNLRTAQMEETIATLKAQNAQLKKALSAAGDKP